MKGSRPVAALLLALLLSGLSAPAPAPRPGVGALPEGERVTVVASAAALDWPAGPVDLLAAVALRSGDRRFGGLSGITVTPDGSRLQLISDRGVLFEGTIRREDGVLRGLGTVRAFPLAGRDGEAVTGQDRDAEGLAVWPSAGFAVSFEGHHRVWRYPAPGSAARRVAAPGDAARLPVNTGLEALAADADGWLYTLPEAPPQAGPYPLWRRDPDSGAWEAGRWPHRPPFRVTGADVGPDGRLYVLERGFGWLGGWSMRLSRADLSSWPDLVPETLLTLRQGGIDNMEGVAVWRDAAGRLRALLVSDDNFHPLQRTLLIEVALPG